MKIFETLEFEKQDDIGILWFNRPDIHNAFNERMISEIIEAIEMGPRQCDTSGQTVSRRCYHLVAGPLVIGVQEEQPHSQQMGSQECPG